jgi:hypothetical protein
VTPTVDPFTNKRLIKHLFVWQQCKLQHTAVDGKGVQYHDSSALVQLPGLARGDDGRQRRGWSAGRLVIGEGVTSPWAALRFLIGFRMLKQRGE